MPTPTARGWSARRRPRRRPPAWAPTSASTGRCSPPWRCESWPATCRPSATSPSRLTWSPARWPAWSPARGCEMALAPRVVVVHRRTELDGLVERHGTRGQAEFFLRTRGRTLADVQVHHDAQSSALATVRSAIPGDWRRGDVEREDLYRFGFEPGDVVVVVGQDGLVANVAKYLTSQPVVGVDPERGRNAGVLVTHAADEAGAVVMDV